MPDGHVYGYKVAVDAWNAAGCINGDPNDIRDIEDDKDLGKSTKLGCTNTVKKPSDA